ncbi:MAG: hypothetical protein ACOCWR_09190, partial [Oceanidesulfovibrio sp.]
MPTRNRPLVVTATAVAVALALLACVFLLRPRSVENTVPFAPYTALRQLYFLESEGGWLFSAPVTLTAPAPGKQLHSLVFKVALNWPSLPLEEARIDLEGTECSFLSRQTALDNGHELVLEATGCAADVAQGDVLRGTLTVAFQSPGTIAIVLPQDLDAPGMLNIVPPDGPDTALPVLGYFTTRSSPETCRLIEQIAGIWTLPAMQWLVPFVLCCGALLVALGGALLGMASFRWRNMAAMG